MLPAPGSAAATVQPAVVIRKVQRRILPFLFICYLFAYLDRANVAFAKLTMLPDLGFSEAVYGLGAGLFFIGYFLLEIPGALIVQKFGARRWIARILITWGFCSTLVGFVRTPHEFYAARFLLGAAEAGFFPGVIVYLSHWFPYSYRARAMARFVMAIPLGLMLGAPGSGLLLRQHWFGLEGWRWVFIIEGLPAVVLGVITLRYLTDWPKDAKWLEPAEREWLASEIEQENVKKGAGRKISIWRAMRQRNVLLLALILCAANTGGSGYLFWLPTRIQQASSFSPLASSMLSALPFMAGMIALFLMGRSSDRTGERKWHTAIPLFLSGCLFALTVISNHPFALLLGLLCMAAAAMYAWIPAFWVLPTMTLGEYGAAAAIGLMNSIGNLGGFFGPTLVGFVITRYGSYSAAVLFLSSCFVIGSLLVFALRDQSESSGL
jgi:ACS family tartrate transporter-like MFS transporter